jgi:peptidoglycan/LPS O-acetylase OafA/YrhL
VEASIESGRKLYLDGVRGVAACVVFFGHLLLALTGAPLIFNGNAAVCIFFVLSGYVLSELSQHSGLSFLAQALRRYLRLIVPMLITSTFAWALLAFGAYRNQEAALGRLSFVLYLIHVPIICSLTSWMLIALPINFALPTSAIATLVVVFAISNASYRYIDQIPTRWSRSAGNWFDSIFGARLPAVSKAPSTAPVAD